VIEVFCPNGHLVVIEFPEYTFCPTCGEELAICRSDGCGYIDIGSDFCPFCGDSMRRDE